MYRGGIRAAEITMTVPGAIRALEKAADQFGDKLVLGAGTVLDPETARVLHAGRRGVFRYAEPARLDHRDGQALFQSHLSRAR